MNTENVSKELALSNNILTDFSVAWFRTLVFSLSRTRYWDAADCGGYGGTITMPAQHRDVYQPSAMDDGIGCVRLEAALRRMITVWHQSNARAIRKYKDPSALLSLSWYFDVTQWSFCAALLQVEHTYRLSAQHMANAWGRAEPIQN